jgi:ABC-type transporter Mla maintaining outer membrane lipid asymmetry ATPase subunit MlaF
VSPDQAVDVDGSQATVSEAAVSEAAVAEAAASEAAVASEPVRTFEASSVELDGVTKMFGDVVALREVSLDAQPGEFLVLLGPSGCGKSTVLRLIAGLEAPTAGTIRIGGREMNRVVTKDRDVAMVFQSYALYPHLNVT